LRLRRMSKNDWVIQNAPLSSVGRTIIQLAKSLNLRTINIVRRPDAVQEVMELGGDIALEDGEALPSRVQKAIGKGKIKLALDAVGGLSTWSLASCLDRDGMLVNYGMLSGELCQIGPDQLIFNGINLQGFWLSRILNRLTEQERNDLFDEIIELMSSGTIHGIVDSCFSLNQIADALKRAETPGRTGKVMLLPNGEL
nr:zinc-binding dehydrogenase [Granulosicoccus sp.]